jgi:hypothetical protein
MNDPGENVWALVEELFQGVRVNRNRVMRAMINLCLFYDIPLDTMNDGLTTDIGEPFDGKEGDDLDEAINDAMQELYADDPLMYVDY